MKILIGGSPCTRWSIAQTKNRETEASGIGWELFLNYRIARDKYQPDYFLYENNKSMSPAIRAQITAELGVWYRTEEARKAAYTKLARQVEIGKRQDAENILYRPRLIETCINKTDKRTMRIWKQLQQLLHLESEETE